MPLRGNLHAHSLFSDGVRSAEQVIAAYEALGYDFLAITDHDDRVPPHYWRALAALRPRLLLFRGIELDYRPLSQHVGRVYGDREVLHVLNHPARYNLSLDETTRRVAIISGEGLAIDAVAALMEQLRARLGDSERRQLEALLTDLRMNFLQQRDRT